MHADNAHSNLAPTLPPSAASTFVNMVGFACFVIGCYALRQTDNTSLLEISLTLLCIVAVPQIILELAFRRVYQRKSTGLDFSSEKYGGWRRPLVKLFGFYMTFAALAGIYWLLPEYHGTYYDSFWDALRLILPYFLLFAFPYFIFLDRFMRTPEDGYWHFGMLCLGQFRQVRKDMLIQYALAWLVKGFYIPLMFIMYLHGCEYFFNADLDKILSSPANVFAFFFEFSYLIDLVFGFIGYIVTLRLLDTHIRSAEPTLKGWAFALICYEPFWAMVYPLYFAYDSDGVAWGGWLQNQPTLYMIWAGLILILLIIYAFSTVAFGLRFSNLTHRGVLTNGTYRYCKHPGYVSKNISWWLISVPFVVESDIGDALRDCIMLLGVNFIYYMRAKTEENHMSWDPVYRQYALAMNEKSIFRSLGRVFPFLRYKVPSGPHSLARLEQE